MALLYPDFFKKTLTLLPRFRKHKNNRHHQNHPELHHQCDTRNGILIHHPIDTRRQILLVPDTSQLRLGFKLLDILTLRFLTIWFVN